MGPAAMSAAGPFYWKEGFVRHTFGQAKQALARFASGYALLDIGSAINTAMDELSQDKRVFSKLRKVMRLNVGSEYFALPQGCGNLIRAAIDGTPVTLQGPEYEFLHSGPGDLDFVDPGWAPLHGIQRVGVFPTMYALTEVMPLAAVSTAVPAGPLRVRGLDVNGERISETVTVTPVTSLDDELAPEDVTWTTKEFASIESVTVPSDASAYLRLVSVSGGGDIYTLSRMHPKVAIPEFTRYRLPGFSPHTTNKTYRVLAEVALQFIPLVDDDEVIPFDSLLPVQYMMQAMASMEAGEVKTADEYRQRAEVLLLRREESELEKQTLHVVNMLYDGSPGEMTDRYNNI